MYEQAFQDDLGYLGDLETASRRYDELREEGEKKIQRREELRSMYEEAMKQIDNAVRLEALRIEGEEAVKLREGRKKSYEVALKGIAELEESREAAKFEAQRKDGEEAIKQREEKRKLYEEAAFKHIALLQ